MDIAGAKQTIALISGQIDKETDPVQIIQHRLFLARLQIELRDKAGVKANLGQLMQTLDARDIAVFKNLVPEPPPGQPIEAAIQDQLFQVYIIAAELFSRADAPAESKSAIDKAAALARLEPVAVQKAEKLLMLARFLAE
jgi:hypothetical protein